MHKNKREIQGLFILITLCFGLFLLAPLGKLLIGTFNLGEGSIFRFYEETFSEPLTMIVIWNSIKVSTIAASISTVLAFLLAYGYHFTHITAKEKHWIDIGISLPMLLPTITYGFVIMYGLGRQGLLTKLVGTQFIKIYGFNGLLLGYLIYTLPIAFLVLSDAFRYIDKKYIVISKLMGDKWYQTLFYNVVRPIIGAIGGTFLLTFVLSFTDFGIPASVGGTYKVVASQLYHVMLGAIPDFGKGSVIAIIMLFPSILGVVMLNYLEKFKFHYSQVSDIALPENKRRDKYFRGLFIIVIGSILLLFVVMFITPFVRHYPYDMAFTWDHALGAIMSNNVFGVYKNSIIVAVLTALFGTFLAYSAALINSRSRISNRQKMFIDGLATISNSVPGMVLGLSYLFLFRTASFKGTYFIIIFCNMVHLFATPYLMAKNALSKMNMNYEVIGQIMGDSWIQSIMRIIIPNSLSTMIQMISYFFIHGMITISAVIFLVTARTGLMTSKIKELQHYANFNEIFILSILIFITNLVIKFTLNVLDNRLSIRS